MNEATYTIKEVEAYHRGELSAAQMHALEEASLADPFLADALEGYRLSPAAAAERSALKERLAQRLRAPQQRKIFALDAAWLKIAAVFLVVLGAGWLIRQATTDSATNETVSGPANTVANAPASQATRTETAPVADTSAYQKMLTETVALNQPKNKTLPPAEWEKTANGNVDEAKQATDESQSATGYEAAAPLAMSRQLDSGAAVAREKVTADKNTTADIQSRSPRADTLRNLNVVLKSIPIDKADVVVLNKKARPQTGRPQPLIDTLEPAQGWNHFDDYIASNINQPDEYKTKPQGGEVELSFDVNAVGEPVNIVVTKSLCGKCDEEAVRLLKAGPKWVAKKKKGKVKIKF